MNIFAKPDSKYTTIIDKYKKPKEIPQISIPVTYNGKQYSEIIYYASSLFGTPKDTINGIIYLDQTGAVVTDKRIIKELTSLYYSLELFFDDKYINNLSKTVIPETQLQQDEAEAEFIESNLMLLSTENIDGIEIIKDIIKKLPGMKRENNSAIQDFIEKIKQYNEGTVISNIIINELKPLYNNTLMKNFEKVKLIGTGRSYYGAIKKGMSKLFKRKFMKPGVTGSAANIDFSLNYLIRVANLYEAVIDMSHSEYIKYLNDIDKDRISERIEKIRE